jgi:hypothetical protein
MRIILIRSEGAAFYFGHTPNLGPIEEVGRGPLPKSKFVNFFYKF